MSAVAEEIEELETDIRIWWSRRHDTYHPPQARWSPPFVRKLIRGDVQRLRFLRRTRAAAAEAMR